MEIKCTFFFQLKFEKKCVVYKTSSWCKTELTYVNTLYSFADERQRGRFAGFSLYVSNTDVTSEAEIKNSTLCYKDRPQLPPLNFTTMCPEKGQYVIYYNERLAGINYPTGYEVDNVNTELCEVIVQGNF